MELLGKMLKHAFRLNDMPIGINHVHCPSSFYSFLTEVSLFAAQNSCQAFSPGGRLAVEPSHRALRAIDQRPLYLLYRLRGKAFVGQPARVVAERFRRGVHEILLVNDGNDVACCRLSLLSLY